MVNRRPYPFYLFRGFPGAEMFESRDMGVFSGRIKDAFVSDFKFTALYGARDDAAVVAG